MVRCSNVELVAIGSCEQPVSASATGGPILGRYTPVTPPEDELLTVRLLRMPIGLFLRAREHHDELVRELTLMAMRANTPERGPQLPPRLGELVDILGRRFGATASRADAERDAAIERGDTTVDLRYRVPASIGTDLVALNELIDDADEFCRTGQLLTLPRDAAIARFGHWYNGEFLRQLQGLDPIPWDGPLD